MRVLLVDDEPFCLSVACRFLEELGHSVTAANSVDEALNLLNSVEFDLVVTDIVMPHKLGFELIQYIKTMDKSIPVIAVTGGFENAVEDYVNQAEIFADVALAKPLYKDSFAETINALCPPLH